MSDTTHDSDKEVSDAELSAQHESNGHSAFDYYRHLRRAKSFVEANIHEPLSLTDVAAELGVSPSRLSHLFRDKAGITFSRWLTEKRVQRAKDLIAREDVSMLALAEYSGFRSYRSFQRSFKRVTGVAPSDYREECRAQIVTGTHKVLSDT